MFVYPFIVSFLFEMPPESYFASQFSIGFIFIASGVLGIRFVGMEWIWGDSPQPLHKKRVRG